MERRTASQRVFGVAALGALLIVTLTGCLWRDVTTLASDDMQGRKWGTPGGAAARSYLVKRLARLAQPINPAAAGEARYTQTVGAGANVIGIIPGTDLAGEYVLIGAHYDHLGNACGGTTAPDRICNGATDNATGVAAALAIAEDLAAHPGRRSVVIALFDGEESSHAGSKAYVAAPVVPLAQTVATVNIDMLGVNILPSARNNLFVLGEETGGAVLSDAVQAAADENSLDEARLSAILGAYRSDYAEFLGKQVPTLFFSDSTGGCYHTTEDEVGIVDWNKLDRETALIQQTVRGLVERDDRPVWTAAPIVTYEDAVVVTDLVERTIDDWYLLTPWDWQSYVGFALGGMRSIVAAGPDAFPGNANSFLSLASQASDGLSHTDCDGFLTEPTTTTTTSTTLVP